MPCSCCDELVVHSRKSTISVSLRDFVTKNLWLQFNRDIWWITKSCSFLINICDLNKFPGPFVILIEIELDYDLTYFPVFSFRFPLPTHLWVSRLVHVGELFHRIFIFHAWTVSRHPSSLLSIQTGKKIIGKSILKKTKHFLFILHESYKSPRRLLAGLKWIFVVIFWLIKWNDLLHNYQWRLMSSGLESNPPISRATWKFHWNS